MKKQALFLLGLLLAGLGAIAATRVAPVGASSPSLAGEATSSGSSTSPVTISSLSIPAGDLIVVMTLDAGASCSPAPGVQSPCVSSVTDSAGDSYSYAVLSAKYSDTEIWYGFAGSAGVTSVSVNFSYMPLVAGFAVAWFSVSGSWSLYETSHASGSGIGIADVSTIGNSNSLDVGFITTYGSSVSLLEANAASGNKQIENVVISSSGNYGQMTSGYVADASSSLEFIVQGSSTAWDEAGVAFVPSSSGSGGGGTGTGSSTGFAAFKPVSARQAQFFDGFDLNPVGTQSPVPFTFGTNNAGCISGAVKDGVPALSVPNSYAISFAANGGACTQKAGNSGFIVAQLNASQTYTEATAYFTAEPVPPAKDGYTVTLTLNDSVAGSLSVEGNVTAAAASKSFFEVTLPIGATPGQPVTLTIAATVSNPDGAAYQIFLDNVTVEGANAIVPGANLFLQDFATHQWFSIYSYPGSYVSVSYSSGVILNFGNLTYPDLIVPLSGATLITVFVGTAGGYVRTIIPNAAGPNTVWLNPPSEVSHFIIEVQDLTGRFGPGTTVRVFFTSPNGTIERVTSGYTDASDYFSAPLVPAVYTVELSSAGNSYEQALSLSSTDLTPTIQILSVANNGGGLGSAVTFETGWNNPPSQIIVYYTDKTNTTVSLTLQLWLYNSSGEYLVGGGAFSGHYGTFEYLLPANPNLSSEYYVVLKAVDEFGPTTYGPVSPTGGQAPVNGGVPISGYLLGLDFIIPTTLGWQFFFALAFLVILGGIFGAVASPAGFIILSLFAGFFGLMGWLPMGTSLAAFGTTVAVTIYLIRRERQLPPID